MIISVHMPKSGGASFGHLLENHFKKAYLSDHDYPIHDSEKKRHRKVKRKKVWNKISDNLFFRFHNVDCIHGHFLPYKYEHFYEVGEHTFITWLRDPIARLASHYHYWKQYHDKMEQRPLLKKLLEEEWTFEEFAFSEEMQNIYSLFLWNFPVQRFRFIGITEFFDDDLSFFAENYLDISNFTIPKKNVNTKSKREKITDSGLIKELKEFHAEDYKLYNYALEQRSKR